MNLFREYVVPIVDDNPAHPPTWNQKPETIRDRYYAVFNDSLPIILAYVDQTEDKNTILKLFIQFFK